MANIYSTITEIEKLSPELARQVKSFVQNHSYGLVYERNLPDAVRLWNKEVEKRDKVHILPKRGMMETDENFKIWYVSDIDDDNVYLVNEQDECIVNKCDVVSVVDYKDSIYPGLRVIDKVERGDKDAPYHMVINAENYHALQMLQYTYAGKVDCIYIDPPYNTGNKDWKYNNNYVREDDLYRHSKWLTFMERRLKLAKDLLKPDSVMIVTIDEKEYLRLGMLLEQLFPEARMQMISSVINPAGATRINQFSRTDEYLFIIQFGNSSPSILNLSSVWSNKKYLSDVQKLRWDGMLRGGSTREESPNLFYPLYIDANNVKLLGAGNPFPLGVNPSPIYMGKDGYTTIFPFNSNGTAGRWQISKEEFLSKLKKGFVRIRKTNKGNFSISYLKKGEQEKVESGYFKIVGYDTDSSVLTSVVREEKGIRCGTQWNVSSHNATEYGTKLNKLFLINRKFPYPKSLYAVEDVLRFFVANKPNALIVDFFAGSGTTVHATMLLNHLDGGHRRCISITNNEIGPDNEKQLTKQGLRPTDKEWQDKGIARYITWERIKAAIMGIATNGEPIKGDYKFTEEFPMSEGFKENIIFCELTYKNVWDIRLDRAFDSIATILWLKAGGKGKIIRKIKKGYATTDNYAVLFRYDSLNDLVRAIRNKPSIKCVFVVSDDNNRYQIIKDRLVKMIKEINIHRLYSSYIRQFEIKGEGGLD